MILDNIFLSVFILFIWFETDAFIRYFSFLKSVKNYKDYKLINSEINYPEFLYLKSSNFLTKLISCPSCLLFWTLILICFLTTFSHFFAQYILAYSIFRIIRKL